MKAAVIVGILIVVVAALLWMRKSPEQARLEGPVSSWKIPDSWSIGRGDRDGKPIITRFNLGLRPLIGNPAFKKQLGIAVPFTHPTDNGLPGSQESEQLYKLEDEIGRRFSAGNESLLAGIITTGNMREFVLYTSDESAAVAKAEQLAKDINHHTVQYVVNDDPEWKVFKQIAGL